MKCKCPTYDDDIGPKIKNQALKYLGHKMCSKNKFYWYRPHVYKKNLLSKTIKENGLEKRYVRFEPTSQLNGKPD